MRNKIIGRKKRKRGVEVNIPGVVVALIIVVFVVVIVIFVAANEASGGIIKKFSNLLPDFIKANATAPEYIPCPDGFTNIGYIDSNNYININGKKTNLYVGSGDKSETIFLNIKDIGLGIDRLVRDNVMGNINNGVILVYLPDNLDQYELEYRNLFPEEKDIRLLNRARIYEGNLCLLNSYIDSFENQDKCILTCAIVDGVCSKTSISGRVAYKQLNCLDGEICYVDETETKIVSQNLAIDNNIDKVYTRLLRFISPRAISGTQEISQAVNVNEFTLTIPERDKLWMEVVYSAPFCYTFDSDNPDLFFERKYESGGTNTNPSFEFTYSGEKFMHFVAWTNDGKQKVIKRWKLNSRGVAPQFEEGGIIRNEEFYGKVVDAEVGSVLYIFGLDREWNSGSDIIKVYDYKIVKNNVDRVTIYARDREHGAQGQAESWHPLYCNKDDSSTWTRLKTFFNFRDSTVIGDKLMSFGEFLDKNCRWDK